MTSNLKKVVASLDLGADKVVCLIGYINNIGKICIKGVGHQKSRGISNGLITDIKLASQSIISAVSLAEKMAGYNISKISVNISGSQISSVDVNTQLQINGREITQKDVSILAKNVQSSFKNLDKEVIHLIPVEYSIDGIGGIKNPRGMSGNTLGVQFQTITCPMSVIKNIETCIKKIPLEIHNFISTPYASALACLNSVEMEDGSLLIDIGAGNTSFAVMYSDRFIYSGDVPIGGMHITKDISTILQTTLSIAEKVKTVNTDFTIDDLAQDDLIKIDIDDENSYNIAKTQRKVVNDIYRSRIEQILTIIDKMISSKGLSRIIQNVVLTGGSALVPGIDNLASHILKKSVRIGVPECMISSDLELSKNLQNTIYSTSIGTLKYLQKMSEKTTIDNFESSGGGKINKLLLFFKKVFTS